MAESRSQAGSGDSSSWKRVEPPKVSVPKGGGPIRGIGEKFAANPVTGTGSLTVPIAVSPGRSGFGPQLTLSYDSGSGNGPFGFGWSLSLPSIQRKTDKGLPKYDDSDVFILSGAEDLVPDTRNGPDAEGYTIRLYRPRIEGLFARIEQWISENDGGAHWRSISRDNITTVYGKDAKSRMVDPADPLGRRIFSWLIYPAETIDSYNLYSYVPQNPTVLTDREGSFVNPDRLASIKDLEKQFRAALQSEAKRRVIAESKMADTWSRWSQQQQLDFLSKHVFNPGGKDDATNRFAYSRVGYIDVGHFFAVAKNVHRVAQRKTFIERHILGNYTESVYAGLTFLSSYGIEVHQFATKMLGDTRVWCGFHQYVRSDIRTGPILMKLGPEWDWLKEGGWGWDPTRMKEMGWATSAFTYEDSEKRSSFQRSNSQSHGCCLAISVPSVARIFRS